MNNLMELYRLRPVFRSHLGLPVYFPGSLRILRSSVRTYLFNHARIRLLSVILQRILILLILMVTDNGSLMINPWTIHLG